MGVLYVLLSFICLILVLVYAISNRKSDYWKKKKVPYAKPLPFVGNYGEYIFLKKYAGKVTQHLCQQFPDEPYFGTFYGTEPALVVQDPEIIKQVVIKDYLYFTGRELMDYSHKETITRNIFFSGGDNWKVVRQSLTPLFSTAKMKKMFYLIQKCNQDFEEMLDREVNISEVIAARDLTARYAMDCICSCAFGIESNTMGKDPEKNAFKIMGDVIMEPSNRRGFKKIARAMWPDIFYGLGLINFPPAINGFFSQLLQKVFESRQYQPSQRHDLVDQILMWNKLDYLSGDSVNNFKTGVNEKVQIKVDKDLMIAQCVLFFTAGFDSSASTLCFTLYEFAKNLEAQELALREVDEYLRKQDGKLDYNCITDLPYLNACIHETMRLYPTFGLLPRQVSHNYTFPMGLSVERGLRIHIPVYHLHHDPRNFADPEEYKPERFMPDRIHEIKPYTYFPFGEGARVCIGKRLAKMQVLAGLITFLKKYRVEMADDTPRTVELDPRIFAIKSICKIKLKFVKRH